ncbi:MAG: alpha/beta hydrolase, partial [Actinomycetota bacterium]|nr:alpha/beta hydrolase [Actinomycetota bacterium]
LGRPSLHTHMRVQRWTLDEMAMPGQLFEDIVEQLYRHDRFMSGDLVLGGRRIGPEMVDCPLLSVVNPASRVIPPQSVLPFHEAAASGTKTLLEYRGDQGVALQHVGVLVGTRAHATVWPRVVDWLQEVSA